MREQKKMHAKDLEQLLQRANINQFNYIIEAGQYQFLLYLDCRNRSNAVCRGTLQYVSGCCQLQIQSNSWRRCVIEPEELQHRNEILRQTLRYPPQFYQADDGVWLQAFIAPGAQMEYHFSTTLLLMLRILQDFQSSEKI